MRDYFEILGVSADAKPEEVRRAYKKMLKVWDPGRFEADPELKKNAEEQTQLIHHAFNAYSSTLSISEQFWLKEDEAATQAYRPQKKPAQNFLQEFFSKRWTGALIIFVLSGILAAGGQYAPRVVAELKRYTPYHEAAVARDPRFFVRPIRRGNFYYAEHDFSAQPPPKKPALILAAASCDVALLQELIRGGADTETQDNNGETALLWASKQRCTAAAKVLIANGANVNIRTKSGFTPLVWAFNNQSPGMEMLLASAGALPPVRID